MADSKIIQDKTEQPELHHAVKQALAYRFNLKEDQASHAEIDRNIRDGVEIKGTNLWVLMFAIFIASIGLNVNSTAVIIGAMLISPLMGPIMGVGYGVGINDFALIRRALTNLGIAILISLATSTLYFLVSPLSEAQSELLARTTPTIWDVLIALFGGLAGIVASTRKEKSNVIPGVAIATALMPPLCTAGYGIATGSAHYFLGAFYLFFINSVFIAYSTLIFISYINPPHKIFISPQVESKVKRVLYLVVAVTVLPSIYLAYSLVDEEFFRANANAYIKNEFLFENSFIAKQNIEPKKRTIELTLIGDPLSANKLAELRGRLATYHLGTSRLITHQQSDQEIDLASLRSGLLNDMLESNKKTFIEKNDKIVEMEQALTLMEHDLRKKEQELAKLNNSQQEQQKIAEELRTQYPDIRQIALAQTPLWEADGTSKNRILVVSITSNRRLSRGEQRKIVAWLKVRVGVERVTLSF